MLLTNKHITKKLIIDTLYKLGYQLFTAEHQLNIIGIRAHEKKVNLFNDRIVLFYDDNFHIFKASTKPGKYWLNNLINKKGTAILKPGQYKNAYILGLHKNKYLALVQRGAEVVVYRDKDLDNEFDMKDATVETGYFGINIHRASKFHLSELVGKWSAGCQVIQSKDDFNLLIQIAQKYKDFQPKPGFFTYTLLNEINIINTL